MKKQNEQTAPTTEQQATQQAAQQTEPQTEQTEPQATPQESILVKYANAKKNLATTLKTANGYAILGDKKIALCTSDAKSYYIRLDGVTMTADLNDANTKKTVVDGYEARIAAKLDGTTATAKTATAKTARPQNTLAALKQALITLEREQQAINEWLNGLNVEVASKKARLSELPQAIATARQDLTAAQSQCALAFASSLANDKTATATAVLDILRANGLTLNDLTAMATAPTDTAPTAK